MVRRALMVAAAALALIGCGGAGTGNDTGSVRVVALSEAKQLIADGVTVIDVRTPQEYAEEHVAGAYNVDVQASDFVGRVDALDLPEPYLVYCRSGNRSAAAARQLLDAGFVDVVDAGGLDALTDAGVPTE